MVTAVALSDSPWLISSGEAWLAGVPFLVDHRALVPRSPIAQLLTEELSPWWVASSPPSHIVDVCCGGGSLGHCGGDLFSPGHGHTLSDLDSQALSLAAENMPLQCSGVTGWLPAGRLTGAAGCR